MSSEKTPNLQLHRWQPSDYVLRTEFNDNFAKIDDHAKQVTEQLAQIGHNLLLSGAMSDGVIDDATKINEYLSQVSIGGGGDVIVPSRIYAISTTLTIPSNINLVGVGMPTFKNIGIIDAPMFLVRNKQQVSLSNLKLDFNKSNTIMSGTEHCIRVSSSDQIKIENCILENTRGDGVYITSSSNVTVFKNEIRNHDRNGIAIAGNTHNCYIRENHIHSGTFAGINAESANTESIVENVHIENNRCFGTQSNGINFTTTFTSDFIKYRNCSIRNNYIQGYFEGITVRASQMVTIEGNNIIDANRGISVGLSGQVCEDVIISKNFVKNRDTSTSNNISVVWAKSTKIINNTCRNAGRTGIFVTSSPMCLIEGNHIYSPKEYGISVAQTASFGTKIINNYIVDAVTIGIRISATTAQDELGITISNNFIQGNSITGYGIRFYFDPSKVIVLRNETYGIKWDDMMLGSGSSVLVEGNNYTPLSNNI